MAERRMFAKSIVLSDAFLDMPLSARCLYFTLGMLADDDGFVGNPKSIIRQCGATQDDMLILFQKRFLLTFDSGIIVIKHWRINNYLRSDRHTSTNYKEELRTLMLDENNAYTEQNNVGIPPDNQRYTQDSIGKDSIGKDSVESSGDKLLSQDNNKKEKQINYPCVLLADGDLENLKKEMTDYCEGVPSYQFYLERMSNWGQKNGKNYTAYDVLSWYRRDKAENKRVFTSAPAAPSYSKDNWFEQAMLKTPKYERKKKE